MVEYLKKVVKALDSAEKNLAETRRIFVDTAHANERKIDLLKIELINQIGSEIYRLNNRLKADADKSRKCDQGFCEDTEKTRQIRSLIK